MKNHLFILLAIYSGFSAAQAVENDPLSLYEKETTSTGTSASLTLNDCYEHALHQSEILKNQKELIEQAHADARASLAGALPKLKWVLTDLIQDTRQSGNEGSGVGSTLTRKERIEHRFNLDQSLFSGFREGSATQGFNKEAERDRLKLRRAGINLFHTVSDVFYSVILAESNLGNTRTALKLSRDRVKELKDRARLGKTRESEVLSAQAQLSTLLSDEISNLSEVASLRESLSFLVGRDVSKNILVDQIPEQLPLASLEEALSKAQSRTDYLAQLEDVLSKRLLVRYERGGYWPSLGLSGNYYTRRVGFQDGIDWDALFTLTVPVYQGGGTAAKVRTALSELRVAENNLSYIQRQIESEVREAYSRLRYSLQEVKVREEAYQASQKSYEMQAKEYRLGLVNNLEVLAALNEALENKRRFDASLIHIKQNYLLFKTAVEEGLGS